MTDVAVVGRFAGSTALGAVGSTTTLIYLFTDFLIGMGNGVNVLASRFFGAGNTREFRITVHTSAFICLFMGFVIMILGMTFSEPFLLLLNTKDDLMGGAKLYMRIFLLGMPAMAVFNYGNAVLNAVGDTKRPLYFLSAAGVLNVILNLVFVIGLKLDVAGVAIASVISQYMSAFLIIRLLVKSSSVYALKLSELRINKGRGLDIIKIGLASGIQRAIFQIANLFIQSGVNSFDSIVVRGNAAAANADALVYDVMAAFYSACASFIGQNYGAGKKKRILKSFYISLSYAVLAGLILGTVLYFFGECFLSIFTKEAEVIETGMWRLKIMAFSYFVSAFMDCTICASRGIGKSIVPTVIVMLGSCVFRILWIYTVFAYFHTIPSLYLLYIFSWVITAAAEIIYFICCYRRIPATV